MEDFRLFSADLPESRKLAFGEVDECNEFMARSGINQELLQLKQGKMQAEMAACRLLLARDPGTCSVAPVALEVGFSHLGRFSVTYRRHFHEPPSTTLAKWRIQGHRKRFPGHEQKETPREHIDR